MTHKNLIILNSFDILQKISSTLESLKNEVEFVTSSKELSENQAQVETTKNLYSKVSKFYLKSIAYFYFLKRKMKK